MFKGHLLYYAIVVNNLSSQIFASIFLKYIAIWPISWKRNLNPKQSILLLWITQWKTRLVGGLKHFLFSIIYGITLPID